jgi:serine/threonine protein kinase
MLVPFALFKCVGGAVLKWGIKALSGYLPFGEELGKIAEETERQWEKHRTEQQRKAEIQAIAQASAEELRQQVAAAVAEVGAQLPSQVQQALALYLAQVPATIRQTLRRPADPSGRTIPSGLRLRKGDDLLPFLPPRLPRFKPGDRPAGIGDWELVELLGVGGFGEVWKARNPHLPDAAPVALKFCVDPRAISALRNEAALLGRVASHGKHPGIVTLHHTYLGADPPCLEYEHIDGGDLTGLIQEWHRRGGPTPEKAARVVFRLAGVVGFAHGLQPPIVHRDLKPANILLQIAGNGGSVLKVADFGIGALAARHELDQHSRGTVSGARMQTTLLRGAHTPLYASPQQIKGAAADPRDDVHALGVIWYQLLTGDLASGVPGGVRWVRDLRTRGMDDKLIRLLASCIEARPEDRPADAAVLARRLQALLAENEPVELIAVEPAAKVSPAPLPPQLGTSAPARPGGPTPALAPPPLPQAPPQPAMYGGSEDEQKKFRKKGSDALPQAVPVARPAPVPVAQPVRPSRMHPGLLVGLVLGGVALLAVLVVAILLRGNPSFREAELIIGRWEPDEEGKQGIIWEFTRDGSLIASSPLNPGNRHVTNYKLVSPTRLELELREEDRRVFARLLETGKFREKGIPPSIPEKLTFTVGVSETQLVMTLTPPPGWNTPEVSRTITLRRIGSGQGGNDMPLAPKANPFK